MSHYIISVELECPHDHPLNALTAIEGVLPEGIAIRMRRHRRQMLITHRGSPLVCVEYKELMNPEHVLRWYAKEYDFDLVHLSYSLLPVTVPCELNDIQLREYCTG